MCTIMGGHCIIFGVQDIPRTPTRARHLRNVLQLGVKIRIPNGNRTTRSWPIKLLIIIGHIVTRERRFRLGKFSIVQYTT